MPAAAAPVTAAVLRAAAATHSSIIDRSTLLRGSALAMADSGQQHAAAQRPHPNAADAAEESEEDAGVRPRNVTLDLAAQHEVIRKAADTRPVPHDFVAQSCHGRSPVRGADR